MVQSISTMPKRGCSPATVHSREVRKFALFLASDGMACHSRNTPIRVTRAITRRPALVASAAEEPVADPPRASGVARQGDAAAGARALVDGRDAGDR